jgi:hypothetical protein
VLSAVQAHADLIAVETLAGSLRLVSPGELNTTKDAAAVGGGQQVTVAVERVVDGGLCEQDHLTAR